MITSAELFLNSSFATHPCHFWSSLSVVLKFYCVSDSLEHLFKVDFWVPHTESPFLGPEDWYCSKVPRWCPCHVAGVEITIKSPVLIILFLIVSIRLLWDHHFLLLTSIEIFSHILVPSPSPCFSSRVLLPPKGHLAMSRGIFISVITGREGQEATSCYWYPVDRGQGCC